MKKKKQTMKKYKKGGSSSSDSSGTMRLKRDFLEGIEELEELPLGSRAVSWLPEDVESRLYDKIVNERNDWYNHPYNKFFIKECSGLKEYCQLFPRTCYLNETFLKEKVHVCRDIVRTNNDLNSFFSSELKMNEIDEDIPYMYIEWQEVLEDVLKMASNFTYITIQQKTEIIKFLHELVYEIFGINYTNFDELQEFEEYGYSTWLDLIRYLKPGSFSTGISRAKFEILLYNFGIKLKNKGYSIELIENIKQAFISLLRIYDI